jgi:hypothetical protein
MKSLFTVALGVLLAAIVLPANAQWLNHLTPNIPRTSSGKPNLAAPAPRGADGHPDLSGPWTGRSAIIRVPDEVLTATSKALIHEREENYFKDRPAFQCQPIGPETLVGWRRIIQTPSIIVIAYETLAYRLIFMDGRKLEANPERTWMGYSVRTVGRRHAGRRQLRIQRSHLAGRSRAPHTEALRTTERYCGARSDSSGGVHRDRPWRVREAVDRDV